jgi:hypothetical protein
MEENNAVKPFAISKRVLLGVHIIIPVIAFLIMCDTIFWGGFLKQVLKVDSTNAAIYLLFLELPHVIGSFIGYADSEYLRFYRTRLFIRLPLLLLATAALSFLYLDLAFGVYLVYTMYHSLKQQTGITSLLAGGTSRLHMLWTWSAIVVAVLGNFYVLGSQLTRGVPIFNTTLLLSFCAVIFCLASVAYIVSIRKRDIGLAYACATTVLLLSSYFSVIIGYFFFAILLIRIVHDTTAFIFYAVHDSNRNALTPKNFFYFMLKPLHLPLLIITPLLGVVIAYYLRHIGVTYAQSALLVILLGLSHYYIEGFMWKRESLHRRELRFVP